MGLKPYMRMKKMVITTLASHLKSVLHTIALKTITNVLKIGLKTMKNWYLLT
jgi:hypothetical protein